MVFENEAVQDYEIEYFNKVGEWAKERNTTFVYVLKSRSTGWTGLACEVYYDPATHTLLDKDEWMSTQNVSF